jgi:thiol-disulfide isomerase/thioredoxin
MPSPIVWASILAAAIVTVSLLNACGDSGRADERLPDVEVEPLRGGKTLALDGLAGPAVVNLWATWCAPCKRELPEFEAVHQSMAGSVTFVGVNIGDDHDDAVGYLDDLGITYDQYLDVDSELTQALKTATLPMTLIIDADERVALRHVGPLDQDELIEELGRVRDASS